MSCYSIFTCLSQPLKVSSLHHEEVEAKQTIFVFIDFIFVVAKDFILFGFNILKFLFVLNFLFVYGFDLCVVEIHMMIQIRDGVDFRVFTVIHQLSHLSSFTSCVLKKSRTSHANTNTCPSKRCATQQRCKTRTSSPSRFGANHHPLHEGFLELINNLFWHAWSC